MSTNQPYKNENTLGELSAETFADLLQNPPPGMYVATVSFLVEGKPEQAYFKRADLFPILSFYDEQGNALAYIPGSAHVHLPNDGSERICTIFN